MIFVTLGTHHDPFPRLIEGLSHFAGEDLVVQHGHSPAPIHATETIDFLPFAEMVERIRTADAVITHAGVGSILTCLTHGRTPLVVPREHRFGEHVDDHQVELTRAMADEGTVIPVWDVDALPELVASVPPPSVGPRRADDEFHVAIRDALRPAPRRGRFRRAKSPVAIAS